MSRMLFKLNKQNNAIINEDAIKMHPPFRKLKTDEMQVMILYCDKHAKFHQFPPEKRLLMAKREIWGTSEKPIPDLLKSCMEEYYALQYDQREELISALQWKIELLKKQMLAEPNVKLIPGYVKAMEDLQLKCENLQMDIDAEEDLLELEGGKKQSLLEYMQHNKKLSNMTNEMSHDIKILFQVKETGETGITTEHGDNNTNR
tara:strand:+ start:802 stop:1410 length:609 start_codon:yes stop_codon:yes gene_type:complete